MPVPPTGKIVGVLADEWKVAEDGLTYTFTLRKGVKFHDGKELTADDVKFTYDSIFDPEIDSPRRSTLSLAVAGPDSITAKDPYTVEFKLKQPYAPFLVNIAYRGILPKHILGSLKGKDFNSADFNTKSPIGTGPYKFKEWVKDDHITLVANPDYFKGKPKIDQYIYKVVKDATVVAAQLKTGEIDFAAFEPSLLSEMQTVQHLDIKKYDTFTFTFYSYQLDKAKTDLFQDKAVRQALFYALDRKAMVESILFGQGAVADSIFPLISWARDPNGNPQYTFDPNKAKQLLDEAGWKPGSDGIREKNGKKLAFTIYTNAGNQVRQAFVTAMQQQWKDVGVQATPKTEEWNAFLNRITKSKDFDIFLVGFSWGPDPDESTMWTTESQKGGFNMNSYSNPQVDKLLLDAVKEVNQDKRKALYHEVDKLVLEDLPSPIMIFDKALVGVNKRVQNLDPNAFNTRYNVETWTVTDGR
jgi:peptide/nickel transport system substrate-binding protein